MSNSRRSQLLHVVALTLFGALVLGVSTRPLWHDDIFWHLRTGELIVHTGHVPVVDPYTHTATGQPWTSHEWGFALILYGAYRLGGYPALVAVMALMVAAIFGTLYLQMRRYVAPNRSAITLPLMLVGLGAAEPSCLILRAALLTSLCLAVLGYLLQRLQAEPTRRWIAAICALFVVWANCHAAVAFGLLYLGLSWVQTVVQAWRARPERSWAALVDPGSRSRALLVLGCAAITLLTPNGFDLWTFSFRVNRLFYASGLTWNMGQYRSPTPHSHPFFFFLIAFCLVACLPLRRLAGALGDRTRPALAQFLALIFFACMAVRSNRFILDFVVLALPFCASIWGGTPAVAGSRWASPWLRVANIALVIGAAVLAHPRWPASALERSVPQNLARFVQHEQIAGRMFNYESSGGYLGWQLRQPVYWDGRNDIYGPLAIEFAYTDDFGELVRKHALDILIFDPTYYFKFHDYIKAHHDTWALVYWDDQAAMYLKRGPKFERVIGASEYSLLQPFRLPAEADVKHLVAAPELRARVEAELRRVLAASDEVFLAWYVRGEIALEAGDLQTAQRCLVRASRIDENGQVLYALARVARGLGHEEEARRLLQRAMQREPG